MLILVGSRALITKRHLFSDSVFEQFKIDSNPDWDFIGDWEHVNAFINANPTTHVYPLSKNKLYAFLPSHGHCEFEIAGPGSSAQALLDRIAIQSNGLVTHVQDSELLHVATPKLCLAIKLSHRYLKNSPHFLKTMRHIRVLRRHMTLNGTPPFCDWFTDWITQREKETLDYSHPKLNTTAENFFSEKVLYKYNHDDIHVAVAGIPFVPAYMYYKMDSEEVLCSSKLFFGIDEPTRLRGVLEECYVLALERCLIPNDFKNTATPREAFLKALEKVCTSITSGWFREYAWENYEKIVSRYSVLYVTRFRNSLLKGRIRKEMTAAVTTTATKQ